MNANRTLQILVAALLGVSSAAQAQPAEPDWEQWVCKFCPFPATGPDGSVSASALNVSDDSAKFGDYTGLDEDGVYANAGADLTYRGDDGYAATLRARDLGLDSRSAGIEAGRQGAWTVDLFWDELPKRGDDSVHTVYSGIGSGRLDLPAGWVRSDFTSGMTALDASLRPFTLEHDRETLGLGLELVQSARVRYEVDWTRQTKEGQGLTWGSFLGNAAALTEPLDYQTDQVDAALVFSGETWTLRAAWYGSYFSNRDVALTWENPFNGQATGRMALAPDNRFNQAMLSGAYHLPGWNTTINASYAMGRAEQSDSLLGYTVNPGIAAAALPRESFDGQADTMHGNLRIVTRPFDKLRLVGEYRYDQRDNDSSRDVWRAIQADAFPIAPASNPIYSFQDTDIELSADYAFAREAHGYLGWEREIKKQDFMEVDRVEEDRYMAKVRLRPATDAALTLQAEVAQRDGSGYRPLTAPSPGAQQNPLLRKYYLADRDREALAIQLDVNVGARTTLGARFDTAQDRYDESLVGLVSSEFDQLTVDAAFNVRETIVLSGFWSTERYDSRQAGAASNGAPNTAPPNWDAVTEDEQDMLGIAADWTGLADGKLDLRLDYLRSDASGDIAVATVPGGGRRAFPSITGDLQGVQLRADWHVSPTLSLNAGLRWEEYDADDWAIDGVRPATIPSVLTFGANTLDYDVTVFMLGFDYRFVTEVPAE